MAELDDELQQCIKCSIILSYEVCKGDECHKMHGKPSKNMPDLYCQNCFDEFIRT